MPQRNRKRYEFDTSLAEDVKRPEKQWLASYSDVITLLLVFFVVLLGNSGVSSVKMEAISKSIVGIKETTMSEVKEKIEKVLKEKNLEEVVELEENLEGLDINIKDKLLFGSGESKLTAKKKKLITSIILTFTDLPDRFRFEIEGHTDDVPIKKKDVPSNWYLSSDRALSVLDVFLGLGFKDNRFTVQGFADTKPIVPNKNKRGVAIPNNRAKNRRVVVKIR